MNVVERSVDDADAFVDLQFALQGQSIPTDYADALWGAVREILPWLETEALAGIHPLSGLSPCSDGWYLARRSRLTLRLARQQVTDANALVGKRLNLEGNALEVGAAQVRDLLHAPVLHAKFVAFGRAGATLVAEEAFRAACEAELAALGVKPRLLCGKSRQVSTQQGMLTGFSVVLYELRADAALLLQRQGLGNERKHGCGIFVPHKSAAAFETLE